MAETPGRNGGRSTKETDFLKAYDAHAAAILRHIFFRVNDRDLAEDLLSETFTKTWQYLREGGETKNIKSFLYRVADNLVIDHYRKRSRTNVSLDTLPELSEVIGEDHRDAQVGRLDAAALVQKHLETLPEEYRRMLVLRYVDELEVSEIREVTGKSAPAVYTAIHRALKALKQKIDKEHEA